MNPIGIMQGRLSPRPEGRAQAFPAKTWRQEFTLARDCGFDCIEWLVTGEAVEANPLLDAHGPAEIRGAIEGSGVAVRSICADCFITSPFLRVSKADRCRATRRLEQIVTAAGALGAGVIVVPVIEGNEIRNEADVVDLFDVMSAPLTLARRLGLHIALESDRRGAELAALIDRGGSASLGACVDLGNSVAAGNDLAADIRALGDKVFAVHVKDRARGGDSRMLGGGDVDFDGALVALADAGYSGPLILETPVGDNPAGHARANRAFLINR